MSNSNIWEEMKKLYEKIKDKSPTKLSSEEILFKRHINYALKFFKESKMEKADGRKNFITM